MIPFFKKYFESKVDELFTIDAAGARMLIKNKNDAIRKDYEDRRKYLLDSVYRAIKSSSEQGENCLIIASTDYLSKNPMRWKRQDLNWFFEDYQETFVDQGYTFVIGNNGFQQYRIKIEW